MGGTPKTALSILCFPAEGGDPAVLREIVRGGSAVLEDAGVLVLGGHSVRDPEIKFGYAVTGEVHPKRVITNAGARKGDLLVLTKPLGVGILATALKRGLLPAPLLKRMTRQMKTLNRLAGAAMTASRAHAATDVTGFGLIGHARNVARASRKTLRIWSRAVPLLPGALEFAARSVVSSGLLSNREATDPDVAWDDSVPEALRQVFVDPQTSGGLLIAIPSSRIEALLRRLRRSKVDATVIGEVAAPGARAIEVAA
jgi:selenide,water dikinase